MAEDMSQPTQVMPAGGIAADRTMVAGTGSAGATQMGGSLACPVCQTSNSALETYCSECGFLLTSTPGASDPAPSDGSDLPELVETRSGRRFRLRPGANTVGRENADVMLMDSTVSRKHAELTLEEARVTVADLGSTNGTMVDDVRLAPNEPTEVAPGVVIRFGSATLALVAAGAEAPQAAQPAAAVAAPNGAEQTMVGVPPPGAGAPPSPPMDGAAVGSPDSARASAEGAVAALVSADGSVPDVYLQPGVTSVGRRPGNTVVLAADAYISGRHAEIACEDDRCYLTDIGSTNGTLLNGQRLEAGTRHALVAGDEVQMGQARWRFQPVAAEPEAPDDDARDEAATTEAPGTVTHEGEEP